jgi:hypothetical protein
MQSMNPSQTNQPWLPVGKSKMALCVWCHSVGLLLVTLSSNVFVPELVAGELKLRGSINKLVRQLNDDRAKIRDDAADALVERAGTTAREQEEFLELLPRPNDQMPPAVQDQLTTIRKRVEELAASANTVATSVTLSAVKKPVSEIIATIEEQTGNRLVDYRNQFGQASVDRPLSFDFQKKPFWLAVDEILDLAGLDIYNFSGEGALALVAREEGRRPRTGQAAYSGPFRIEVTRIQAQRDPRQPVQDGLKIGLEVAWEPRFQPLVLTQSLAGIIAVGDDNQPIRSMSENPVLSVEVPAGSQATEFVLPFKLPPRTTQKLVTLRGTLQALVPGRQASFQFDHLAAAAKETQAQGGVRITLDAVRKQNEIWEVHMRLGLKENHQAFESHRGWAYQNATYLLDEKGERIEFAGLETTSQSPSEIGIVYLFDIPDGIENVTWVYETPAAIVLLPVEYQIKNIKLP